MEDWWEEEEEAHVATAKITKRRKPDRILRYAIACDKKKHK